jgi:transcriptional regulator with XRE-family HTH domain
MDIGERIKEIRGTATQEEFAGKLGVHKNTISRWERGERIPDANNLARILEVYQEINPAWLITGAGEIKRRQVEATRFVQNIDNEMFLSNARMIDYYLESKYYEEIPPKTRGLIYSAFHEHIKKEGSWNLFIIASIISELYTPSFTLHDVDISNPIGKLVDIQLGSESDDREKNVLFWSIFDTVCEKFCYKRVVAPNYVKTKIINWLNGEISKATKIEAKK